MGYEIQKWNNNSVQWKTSLRPIKTHTLGPNEDWFVFPSDHKGTVHVVEHGWTVNQHFHFEILERLFVGEDLNSCLMLGSWFMTVHLLMIRLLSDIGIGPSIMCARFGPMQLNLKTLKDHRFSGLANTHGQPSWWAFQKRSFRNVLSSRDWFTECIHARGDHFEGLQPLVCK